jgi:tetratricopeptide (TPR) repeat protein
MAEMYFSRGCVEKAAWLLRHIEELGTSLTKAGIQTMFVGANVFLKEAGRAEARHDTEATRAALEQALLLLKTLRDIHADGASDSDWSNPKLPEGERVKIDSLIGKCYESLGDFEQAREAYERACVTFENLRNLLTEVDFKRGIQTERVGVYVRAARNLYTRYKASGGDVHALAEVVNKIDRGKSRVLLDMVIERVSGAARRHGGSGPVMIPAEVDASRAIAALSSDTAALQYALFPTAVNVPGTWTLFAQTGGETSPRVVMETDKLDSVLRAKEKLDAEADKIESDIVKLSTNASLTPSEIMRAINKILFEESGYVDALEKLSDLLLPGDLAENLARSGVKKLVVSPDAYLYDIPWVSLMPIVENKRRPLIGDDEWEGFEVVIASSFASFLAASAHAGGQSLTGAGDCAKVLLAADPLGDLSKGDHTLKPTVDEIARALERIGCTVELLKGSQVTKTGFVGAGRAAGAIMYVGHAAVMPEEVGGGSVMVLSDGGEGADPLSSDELAQLPDAPVFDQCEVAVLLACSSGQACDVNAGADFLRRVRTGINGREKDRRVAATLFEAAGGRALDLEPPDLLGVHSSLWKTRRRPGRNDEERGRVVTKKKVKDIGVSLRSIRGLEKNSVAREGRSLGNRRRAQKRSAVASALMQNVTTDDV